VTETSSCYVTLATLRRIRSFTTRRGGGTASNPSATGSTRCPPAAGPWPRRAYHASTAATGPLVAAAYATGPGVTPRTGLLVIDTETGRGGAGAPLEHGPASRNSPNPPIYRPLT